MIKYKHHKYTYTNSYGVKSHSWTLIGEKGGLDFHVSLHERIPTPSAGLEIHEFQGEGAPDHVPCWLLNAPCWYDGTSSYAMDILWPMIEPLLKVGNHDIIFKLLEGEATKRGLSGVIATCP